MLPIQTPRSPQRKLPSLLSLESFLAFSPLNVSLNIERIFLVLDLMYKYSCYQYSYVYILGTFPMFSGRMFLRLINLKLKIAQKSPSFHERLTWIHFWGVHRFWCNYLVQHSATPGTRLVSSSHPHRGDGPCRQWWLIRIFSEKYMDMAQCMVFWAYYLFLCVLLIAMSRLIDWRKDEELVHLESTYREFTF